MSKKKFLSQIERDFPARYSDALLPIFEKELIGYPRILDCFAGTGRIREVRPDCELLEIEPEWAAIRGATVGNATKMPWPDNEFDAVVTSPSFANRMADHHHAKDASRRNTYRHRLGRELDPNNTGGMQWGATYRLQHYLAWLEVQRVLKPDGRFILNISDHIRKGRVIPVTRFHHLLLLLMGFRLEKSYRIETPRSRYGQNAGARVAFESVLVYSYLKGGKDPNLNVLMSHWPDLADCPDGVDVFPELPIAGME